MQLEFTVAQIVQVKNRGGVTLQHFANEDDKQPAITVAISFSNPADAAAFTIGKKVQLNINQDQQ